MTENGQSNKFLTKEYVSKIAVIFSELFLLQFLGITNEIVPLLSETKSKLCPGCQE